MKCRQNLSNTKRQSYSQFVHNGLRRSPQTKCWRSPSRYAVQTDVHHHTLPVFSDIGHFCLGEPLGEKQFYILSTFLVIHPKLMTPGEHCKHD